METKDAHWGHKGFHAFILHVLCDNEYALQNFQLILLLRAWACQLFACLVAAAFYYSFLIWDAHVGWCGSGAQLQSDVLALNLLTKCL